ncbi:hypothetical protein, partial [Plesiomonas sp.]|uniref:hypothetical protein n=1 Tax=Plesiomonas sp. TaxID=2486279 RepID=UPI003F40C1C3
MIVDLSISASVKESLETHQKKQKKKFDHGTKQLQKLTVGENVRVWQNGMWNPAQVTALAEQPRSYVVETPDGRLYRMNRKYLMYKTGEYKASTHKTKTEEADQSMIKDCHEPKAVLD